MTVDREHVRRLAQSNIDADSCQWLAEACLALLAELEQAEKDLQNSLDAFNEVAATADRFEARLAKVPALVESIASALTSIATGPLKDGYAYSVLEEALAEWERE